MIFMVSENVYDTYRRCLGLLNTFKCILMPYWAILFTIQIAYFGPIGPGKGKWSKNAIFHDDLNGSIPSTFACKMVRGCKTMSELTNDSSTTSWMHMKHFKVDFEVRKIFIKNRFSVHYFYLKYSQFERVMY